MSTESFAKSIMTKLIKVTKDRNYRNDLDNIRWNFDYIREHCENVWAEDETCARPTSDAKYSIINEMYGFGVEHVKASERIIALQIFSSTADRLLRDSPLCKKTVKSIEERGEYQNDYVSININKTSKQLMTMLKNDKRVLPDIRREYDNILKDEYIDMLGRIGEHFFDTGALKRLIVSHNSNMNLAGVNDLVILGDNGKVDYEITSKVKGAIFSTKTLKEESLEKLTVSTLFWQNKLAKEITTMSQSLMLVDSLGAWEDVRKGKINFANVKEKVSDEQVTEAVAKWKFVNEMCALKFSGSTTDKNGNVMYSKDYIKRIKAYEKEYKEYYSKVFPNCENDLEKDVNDNQNLYMIANNAYALKDNLIDRTMEILKRDKKVLNFGVIKEEEKTNPEFLLLGIDYPGFNMQMEVHAKRKDVIDYLRGMDQSTIIPLYEGDFDKEVRRNHISTNLLFDINSESAKELNFGVIMKKKVEENSSNYNFVKHLQYLAGGKFPEHLQTETLKSGRLVMKKEDRFIDITTGKEYDTFEKRSEDIARRKSKNRKNEKESI